jgi:hypothetical protein
MLMIGLERRGLGAIRGVFGVFFGPGSESGLGGAEEELEVVDGEDIRKFYNVNNYYNQNQIFFRI